MRAERPMLSKSSGGVGQWWPAKPSLMRSAWTERSNPSKRTGYSTSLAEMHLGRASRRERPMACGRQAGRKSLVRTQQLSLALNMPAATAHRVSAKRGVQFDQQSPIHAAADKRCEQTVVQNWKVPLFVVSGCHDLEAP